MTVTDTERGEVVSFADKILRRYFCDCDVEFLISTFDPEIVWLGGGENQRAEGSEAVAKAFRDGRGDLAPCRMWGERYVVLPLDGDCILCEGESLLETLPELPVYMRARQRVTFIFRRTDAGLRTVHIHNSIPFGEIQPDELFPTHAAREACRSLESSLSRKDREIELMLSRLPGGMQICYYDAAFTTKWISDGLCRMLGYGCADEYAADTGNCCRGFIQAEDYGPMCAQVDEAFRRGNAYTAEYRVRRRDGSVFWVQDLGRRVRDEDGEEVVYCFISDITQRKEQELQVEKSNREARRQAEFLSALYDTVPCGIIQFATDESHTLINANRMAWEIYGYTREEYFAIASDPFRLVKDQDETRIHRIADALRLGGGAASYTREGRRKDGSTLWINVIMERLINADGEEVIQAVFTDVSEIRRLQREREQVQIMENRSLRAAICTAYPVIMNVNLTRNTYETVIDGDFIMRPGPRGAVDDVVARSSARIDASQREQFESIFQRCAMLERFRRGENELYMEMRELGDDGACHWISAHAIHVDNPFGSDVLAVVLLRLLDEQRSEKARQEQLLRDALAAAKSASSAKSDFLSRMSHDIRTPMNAIIGMTAVAHQTVEDPQRVRGCLEKIDASSRYLLSLLGDILDMAKIEQGKLNIVEAPFCLEEFLEALEAVHTPQALTRSMGLKIRREGPLAARYVGDALRLNQILVNLLSNAIKFTPPGGKVELTVREARRDRERTWLEFRVSDTGVGMSPEFMKRIFRPFEQESPDAARNNVGSGLGLAIVSSLTELMGGSVGVESTRGRGSAFTVLLPFLPAGEELSGAPSAAAPAGTSPLAGRRVLLAEDNALNREIAVTLLELQGLTVDTAENGEQALRAFADSERGRYLAILMDIRMPVMDGLAATRAIRELPRPDARTVPIIAMTANAFEEDRRQAGEAGMNGYLTKPVDMQALLQELQRYL